jgi:hypothetical protein
MASIKDALKDRRAWAALGVEETQAGGAPFTIDEDDIIVHVTLMPEGTQIKARMAVPGSGATTGVWSIPKSGTEVLVIVPMGEYEFMPAIAACYSSGGLPDGVAENVTVIANGEVIIHDGNGGAEPLVTRTEFNNHIHGTGTGPSAPPAAITGTTVLKAK